MTLLFNGTISQAGCYPVAGFFLSHCGILYKDNGKVKSSAFEFVVFSLLMTLNSCIVNNSTHMVTSIK